MKAELETDIARHNGGWGWGGKVMVTAATLLGDCKHVYNEAIIKLLMLTSHTQ